MKMQLEDEKKYDFKTFYEKGECCIPRNIQFQIKISKGF